MLKRDPSVCRAVVCVLHESSLLRRRVVSANGQVGEQVVLLPSVCRGWARVCCTSAPVAAPFFWHLVEARTTANVHPSFTRVPLSLFRFSSKPSAEQECGGMTVLERTYTLRLCVDVSRQRGRVPVVQQL
ncbi:hypothetical protein DQ04_12361020 [Trypanosoma grayi]|uniref:hypothetical protein n=1 Tax=Trypanosoma grayi TaxID=71804 RepID=UPI0004F42E79|nr:hypothetical protein DQ04_12361020 [Trypanosoma grayi]KEG06764.1 hypothetical protein DQ04_12361020 [Trypanosoma grayi]